MCILILYFGQVLNLKHTLVHVSGSCHNLLAYPPYFYVLFYFAIWGGGGGGSYTGSSYPENVVSLPC